MAQFTYYEVADEQLPALRKLLGKVPDHGLRRDAEASSWLVQSSKALKFEGARKVKPERWEAARVMPVRAPVKGIEPELLARTWKVEPGSRKAQLIRRALTSRRAALELAFGAGSGDVVSIVTEIALPARAQRLHALLCVPAGVVLGVSPSLRTARGRLRAVLETRTLFQPGPATLDWPLPELAVADREAIATLALALSTEADSGSILLDALALLP